jgi:predicted permease
MSSTQDKFLKWMKNPFIIAALIGLFVYYVNSTNYITKENIREKGSLKKQKSSNLKTAFYIFLISVLLLFIFRHALKDAKQINGGNMLSGYPPF